MPSGASAPGRVKASGEKSGCRWQKAATVSSFSTGFMVQVE